MLEAKLGWGKSSDWVNQDFIALSIRIKTETGGSISHITLKRLWGKVNYNGLPQVYTLNTLVQFVGYESWRDFIVKNGTERTVLPPAPEKIDRPARLKRTNKLLISTVLLLFASAGFVIFKPKKLVIKPSDYTFNSHPTQKSGIPNSVVFNFDATKAPVDSVTIQQSWDERLRTRVSKEERQHTLIYYFPGFFQPKLIVNGQIVKEHNLLVKSNGWISAFIDNRPRVYFKKEEIIAGGKMSLPVEKIRAQNVSLTPAVPSLSFCNVQDFGQIYSDNFEFETSLRNDFRNGSAVCQMTNIYILCEGTAINIPLCAKGCESALNFFFTNYNVSGKKKDLSAFGVDFDKFIKVRIKSENGKAEIFLDDKLAYRVNGNISKSKIIGIDYVFQGTGSVDYVKLANDKVNFDDEF